MLLFYFDEELVTWVVTNLVSSCLLLICKSSVMSSAEGFMTQTTVLLLTQTSSCGTVIGVKFIIMLGFSIFLPEVMSQEVQH